MKGLTGIRDALALFLVLSSAFLLVSCGREEVPTGPVDPKVTRILQDVSEHLRGLESFRVEFDTTTKFRLLLWSEKNVAHQLIAMKRPNKFAMIVKKGKFSGIGRLVSDGETLYGYGPVVNRYAVEEAPTDIAAIMSSRAAQGARIGEGTKLFFQLFMGQDTEKSPLSRIDLAKYLGVKKIDGVPCHRLKLHSAGNEWGLEIWVAVDGPPVVMRIVPYLSRPLDGTGNFDGAVALGIMSSKVTTILRDWEFNIDLPDEGFKFTPPPGASLFGAAVYRKKPPAKAP